MIIQKFSHIVLVYFTSIVLQANAPSNAEDRAFSDELVERTYHPPTDSEIEKFRDMLNAVDIEQSIPDRFAYRCKGALFDSNGYEQFISIHAVDRTRDAVRHVVRRTFTDDDDPILLFSIEEFGGFADSRTSNARYFPRQHDWLRIGDEVFLSDDKQAAIPRSKVKLTGQDRNFDPITMSILPFANLFDGNVSKKRVSETFGLDRIKPDRVSVVGNSYVAKLKVMTAKGPTGSEMFIEFVNELPVSFEIWQMLGVKQKQLLYRTLSEWKEFAEVRYPIRLEATQVIGGNVYTFEGNIEWRFNKSIPNRLFKVTDVTSREAYNW